MLVGAANEQYLCTRLSAESGMHIGGQQRAYEVSKMLDAVDIGNSAGDEIAGHARILVGGRRTPKNQKALPLGRKSSGSAHASRGRASTLPATILAVGPEHSMDSDGNRSAHDLWLADLQKKINRRTGHCHST
jgi:hypothetical protein